MFGAQFPGIIAGHQIRLRLRARLCVRLLHRFLHRLLEVLVGHLQVMLVGNRGRVPDPTADDMDRVRLAQLGFPHRPKILEWPLTGCQSRPFNDPDQLRAQIDVRFTISRDDILPTQNPSLGAPVTIPASRANFITVTIAIR